MKMKRLTAMLTAALCGMACLPIGAGAEEALALGDLNGDSVVNTEDAALILVDAAYVGSGSASDFTEAQVTAGDVDKDGLVNSVDAAAILSYAAWTGSGVDVGDMENFLSLPVGELVTFAVPDMEIGTRSSSVRVAWTPQLYADGYEIYRADGSSGYALVATVTGGLTDGYEDMGLDYNVSYYYKMRAYKVVDGVTEYTDFSSVLCSTDMSSILNASELEPHTVFPVYNRQKSEEETTSYDVTLSENDIAILEAFASEHFPEGATQEEKLWITLQWIHTEVDYAYAGDAWNEIAGKSWTEAIFVNKKGQCAQYNGAMASMMAYMGYDVSIVQGWRGTYPSNYWQHFWVEVDLGGVLYMMECGNLGKNGDWYYFLATYDETSGYIRNLVHM